MYAKGSIIEHCILSGGGITSTPPYSLASQIESYGFAPFVAHTQFIYGYGR